MQNEPFFKIVLISPEIPWNVGAIGRTCVGLNLELIIIKPTLVDLTDKAVKRAGLDYWPHVKIKMYKSWQEFLDTEQPESDKLFFFSTKAEKLVFEASFKPGCYLCYGAESKGLSESYHRDYATNMVKLPMFSEHIRSLNLANSVTASAYEALRQIRFI